MEKIIKISGREVLLKNSCYFMVIYKESFQADALIDVMMLTQAFDKSGKLANPAMFNSVTLMQCIWAMAKNADDKLLPFRPWLDSFNHFPVLDLIGDNDVINLLISAITSGDEDEEAADSEAASKKK